MLVVSSDRRLGPLMVLRSQRVGPARREPGPSGGKSNHQSASGRHKGPKSDEGWKRERLVGAVEEQGAQSLDEGQDTGVLP